MFAVNPKVPKQTTSRVTHKVVVHVLTWCGRHIRCMALRFVGTLEEGDYIERNQTLMII